MNRCPLVVPVRYSAGTHAVQTTTRDLSAESAFIRTLQKIEEGARLTLSFSLPRQPQPLVVDGAVVRHGAEKDPGFWIRFDELPPEDKERVERVVKQYANAPPRGRIAAPVAARSVEEPGESRVSPRQKVTLGVRYAPQADFRSEQTVDLSASGLFMRCDDPPGVGTALFLNVEPPQGSGLSELNVKGIVVHRVTRDEAARTGAAPGAGIQFMDYGDEFRERIQLALQAIVAPPKGRGSAGGA